MKKYLALALVCALLAGCFAGCTTPTPQEQTGDETAMYYDVTDFGAKANGSDASAAIQAALDQAAADGGGTVYIPRGTYTVKTTLVKPAKVSVLGAGMNITTLRWEGGSNSAILSTANEALWGTFVSDLSFTQKEGPYWVVGISGGSSLEKYNSAIGTFKNLRFINLGWGIRGNAAPDGVGIFDCLFENIFCSGCEVGLQLYGSGNTIIHPRMAGNEVAVAMSHLNGESFDGLHFIGGIFAANGVDLEIPDQNGLRPCDFVGTWFESSREGIVSVPNSGTKVMNLTFRDCMLDSKQSPVIMDFSNIIGTVTIDSCTFYNEKTVKAPTDPASKLVVKNVTGISGSYYYVDDTQSGSFEAAGDGKTTVFAFPHSLGATPSQVQLTPGSAAAASGWYVTADAEKITVTFASAPKGHVKFYWTVTK